MAGFDFKTKFISYYLKKRVKTNQVQFVTTAVVITRTAAVAHAMTADQNVDHAALTTAATLVSKINRTAAACQTNRPAAAHLDKDHHNSDSTDRVSPCQTTANRWDLTQCQASQDAADQ